MIVVLPQWFPPEGALRLAMARSMLDTDRVAVHETALPPLAAAVLCSLASSLAPHVPSAGVLASLLPELEAELHVFTWLGSVSGLSAPAPSFGQHLASLGPNSAFGVSSWPEPSVHKLSAGEPGVPLPEIARPSRMVVAPRNGDAAWAKDTVNRALGGLPVAEVEATPNGPSWWGTSKVVESVVFPVDAAGPRRGPDGRARAVGLPLVPRADRPLAVPAVRPSRPSGPPSRAAAASAGRRPQVGGGGAGLARVRVVVGHRGARVEALAAAALRRRQHDHAARLLENPCAQLGSQISVRTSPRPLVRAAAPARPAQLRRAAARG